MLKPEKDVKGCYTTDLWAFSKTNVLFPLSPPPPFLKSVQVLSGLKVKLCENKPYIFIYRLNFTARILLYETQHFHKIISLIKWFLFPANLTNSYAALLRSPHTWSLMRINLHLTNGITIEKISFHLLSVTERNGARAYHETAFYLLCDLTSSPKIKGHEVRSAWLAGKHTPTSVRRRSFWVDFRLRNPSSLDVVFVMKALFSILDPQNRVETNTCFVFAHDFVLALRYLHIFPLLTYITDSKKFLQCLLFTDGRLQVTTYIYNYNIVTPPRNLSKGGC